MKLPKELQNIVKDISNEVENSLDKEALEEYKKTKQRIKSMKNSLTSVYKESVSLKNSEKQVLNENHAKSQLCEYCGTEISPTAKFCGACGAKIEVHKVEENVVESKKEKLSDEKRSLNKKMVKKDLSNNVVVQKKNTNPWLAFVLIFVGIVFFISCISGDSDSNSETFKWSEVKLAHILPEPERCVGKIYSNQEDYLSLYLYEVSADDYANYVAECIEKGFDVETESKEEEYKAYNSEGYNLSIDYNSYNESIYVHIEAPMKLEEIQWSETEIAKLLPIPEVLLGKIDVDTDVEFSLYLGEMSIESLQEYIFLCEAKGFNLEQESDEKKYNARNEEGYTVQIEYVGWNVAYVSILEPKYEVEFQIDCAENVIFSKFDVDFYVDGDYEGTITHGAKEEYHINLGSGKHTVTFEKEDDSEVSGVYEFEIKETETMKLEITCYSSYIRILNSNEKEESVVVENEKSKVSILKGTEYAYMTDEWNVYIATAVSDEVIKISNWSKTMSSTKSVSYDYDVGVFKINDEENAFSWVDEEHTAFRITFEDKNNNEFKKGNTAIFTVNISDSDKNKGTNYSDKIACYSYQNDDWHMYRAIPLTEKLIKIEAWSRTNSLNKFLFGYDVCLIELNNEKLDFEWTDEEHTSFLITLKDEKNEYYWKKDKMVLFELENEEYKYFDTKSYIGILEVNDGEVAVPASASDYIYENYQDVQKELSEAGFINVKTEVLYDIIWGWTEEGEVDSVSIDGNSNFDKGQVFKNDATIVITYHMKAEDNPNKSEELEEGSKLEENETDKETIESKDIESESKKTSVYYSTNTRDTVDNGNEGVYSYKSRGGSYDIYWIIDFDAGYVYYFTEGNGNSECDKLKIDSGDLNTSVQVTYHIGGDSWSYKLHFKYIDNPEHLIMNDHNGFSYDYYTTDLSKALVLRNTKTIKEY